MMPLRKSLLASSHQKNTIELASKACKNKSLEAPALTVILFLLSWCLPIIGKSSELSRQFFDDAQLSNVTNSVSRDYKITADSSKVIFSADFDNDDKFELYRIDITGRNPIRLDNRSPDPLFDYEMKDSDDFKLAPNGHYVTFRAKSESSNRKALFAISLLNQSAQIIEVTHPDFIGQNFGLLGVETITFDSQHIVLRTSGPTAIVGGGLSTPNKLVSVSLTNGTLPISLTTSNYHTLATADVFANSLTPQAVISPDSSEVIFGQRVSTNSPSEVFTIPINGGTATKLSNDSSGSFDTIIDDISGDGKFLVYRRETVDDRHTIFVTRLSGGAVMQVNAALQTGEQITGLRSPVTPTISTDGVRLFYFILSQPAPVGAVTLAKLHVVHNPLLPLTITPPSFTGNNALLNHPIFSNDNAKVSYLAATVTNNAITSINLYQNTTIIQPVGPAASPIVHYTKRYVQTADGSQVVMTSGTKQTGGVDQVYANLDTSANTQADQISTFSRNFQFLTYDLRLLPDETSLLVSTPDETALGTPLSGITQDIHIKPIQGGEFKKLSINLTPDGHIVSFRVTPDSKTLVYLADRDQDQLFELYTHPITTTNTSDNTDELCFPIKTPNNAVALVCL